jgi:hypothetical protein
MEIRLEFEAKKDGRTIFLFLLHRQVGSRHPTQEYILTKVKGTVAPDKIGLKVV